MNELSSALYQHFHFDDISGRQHNSAFDTQGLIHTQGLIDTWIRAGIETRFNGRTIHRDRIINTCPRTQYDRRGSTQTIGPICRNCIRGKIGDCGVRLTQRTRCIGRQLIHAKTWPHSGDVVDSVDSQDSRTCWTTKVNELSSALYQHFHFDDISGRQHNSAFDTQGLIHTQGLIDTWIRAGIETRFNGRTIHRDRIINTCPRTQYDGRRRTQTICPICRNCIRGKIGDCGVRLTQRTRCTGRQLIHAKTWTNCRISCERCSSDLQST